MESPRSVSSRSPFRHPGFFLSIVIALILGGCGGERSLPGTQSREKPNVILVSIDTLRADRLHCYGCSEETSPFIDSLARQGVLFENAFAQASWTLPSHMSMMTSLYPHDHLVEKECFTLPPGRETLAMELKKAGYSTAAFVSWIYVSRKFGFARGFDRFHELIPPSRGRAPTAIKAEAFVKRVSEWAEEGPKKPFFLFLHLFDPHMPYDPPLRYARLFDPGCADTTAGAHGYLKKYIRGLNKDPAKIGPELRRKVSALYEGEIRYTDAMIKRLFSLFELKGLLENTMVVLTSDHGEEFGEHGSMEGHQWTLYDEILHVPMIIRFPGGRYAGRRFRGIVESIDIAPTVLARAGLERPDGFEGRSLLSFLEKDEDEGTGRHTFSEIERFNRKKAVRGSRYKLIFTENTRMNVFGVPVKAGFEFYDLAGDPEEKHNIYSPSNPAARRLARLLEDWVSKGSRLSPVPAPGLAPEELRRLRSLGYAW